MAGRDFPIRSATCSLGEGRIPPSGVWKPRASLGGVQVLPLEVLDQT